MASEPLDLVLINPGTGSTTYQDLANDLTAIEPPLWTGLIATYARNHGFSVKIIDAEAEHIGAEQVAARVMSLKPRLVGMIVFGHQPSASTQMMFGAGLECYAIKKRDPSQKIIIVGGHVSALPERTLREESVDFACNGEGPVTIEQLLNALKSGAPPDYSKIEGLVWREGDQVRNNLG